jgi:cytochrome c oxidase subunit IV
MNMNDKKAAAYRKGAMTLGVLAVLTLVEYLLAIGLESATVPLIIIAILKVAIIVQNFMHISQLWSEEGHE